MGKTSVKKIWKSAGRFLSYDHQCWPQQCIANFVPFRTTFM